MWLVREEERIGFETRYTLCDDSKAATLFYICAFLFLTDDHYLGGPPSHDLINPFAILVPSTNYPPAFDTALSPSFGQETDVSSTAYLGLTLMISMIHQGYGHGAYLRILLGAVILEWHTPPDSGRLHVVQCGEDDPEPCRGDGQCDGDAIPTMQ